MDNQHEDEISVTEGSGNVFADLGVSEPEEALAKARLASHILQTIGRRRLTQAKAAQLTGLDQPKISALMNGRLAGFSSDRLVHCLTALGQDVEIVIKTSAGDSGRGRLRVVEPAA
jgi:predicted XRE-type DNA-binding protein